MATIERRKTRNGQSIYRVKVRRKGYPTQTASFPTKKEAEDWAIDREGDVRKARYFGMTAPTIPATQHTLAEAIDRYAVEVLSRKRSKTQKTQASCLKWWKSQLGPFALASITPSMLVESRERLAQTRAPGTVLHSLTTIEHVFTIAAGDWEWLSANPFKKVRKPSRPRGRVRFLSEDERIRLLDACQQSRSRALYPVVMLALATGARKNEIMTLTWADVDMQRAVVIFNETKNGETRTVPLTSHVLNILTKHKQTRPHDSALLFPSRGGKRPLEVRDAWEIARARAKIDNFRFHDLRHTAASYMAMSGASLKEIAEVLGHKRIQQTMIYAHLSEAHTRSVVERMNRAVFGE